MTFDKALAKLRGGEAITRKVFGHAWLAYVKEPRPGIVFHTSADGFRQWTPTLDDVLAHDWRIA